MDRAPSPTLRVPLHVVILSDDDGTRTAGVDSKALSAWVEFANHVFSPAGIRFDFAPETETSTLRTSALNNLPGPPVPEWPQVKPLGDRIAAAHAGTIVALIRHGPGDRLNRPGFSGGSGV